MSWVSDRLGINIDANDSSVGRAARDLSLTLDPVRLVSGGNYASPGTTFIRRNVPGASGSGSSEEYVDPAALEAKRLEELQKKTFDDMLNQAKNFRSQMPGMQNDIYSQIEGDAKSAIMNKQREIRRQANRRGLLYSGLREGAESRAAADISSEAAGSKAKVSPELEGLAADLEARANKMFQEKFANDIDHANSVYDRALNAAKERAAGLDALFSFGGAAAGSYFGSKGEE